LTLASDDGDDGCRMAMDDALPPPFDLDQRPVVAIFRSPVFNASETFVAAQAAALARYQPLVFGLERKGNIPDRLADRVLLARAGREALGLKFGSGSAMAARLGNFRPALLHAHFGPDGLRALPVAMRLGVPLVTTLHGYDVARSIPGLLASGSPAWIRYALFQRRLQRSGSLFIAVSDALRRRALERGYPEARTITHAIGVDLDLFPMGEGGAETILHVGRLVEKKGTDILLRAFARLRARMPAARLQIVGEGPRRAALQRLAGQLGLGDSAAFLGALPPERVGKLMRRATVLAVPSVTAGDGDAEGLPVVIFEAAASGLPVVGSDHAGIPEGVRQGITGYVVPEGAVEPLADRLAELLAQPELRRSMAGAARTLAEESFDLRKQTARLEAHYDALLDAANPRSARARLSEGAARSEG
jgi:glycosyltransferase involved in cell wall biosynthesis